MVRYVKIILLKEFKEILRDRVTFIMLLVELLSIPFLMFSMNYIYKNDVKEIRVAFWKNDDSSESEFNKFLNSVKDVNIILEEVNSRDMADNDVLVSYTEDGIEFVYNSNSYNSYEYSKKLYSKYQNYCLENNNIKLTDESGKIANESRNILNVFIPLILIIIATQGTMELSAGLIAGEREKGTLELLLLNINDKKGILFGKAIVLVIVNVISILTGLFTIFLSSYYFKQDIIQGYNRYVQIFALLILVSVIFTLIALGLSMAIKSYRSSQLIVGIVVSIPSALMGIVAYGLTLKWDSIMMKIPIISLVEAVHKICFGKLTLSNFVYCIVLNIFAGIIIWMLDIKLIQSELI